MKLFESGLQTHIDFQKECIAFAVKQMDLQLRSIFRNGILSASAIETTGFRASEHTTIVQQERDKAGVSGCVVFSDSSRQVIIERLPEDIEKCYVKFEENLAFPDEYMQLFLNREYCSTESESQGLTVLDATIEAALYGTHYGGGVHSVVPVLAERFQESTFNLTGYLKNELLERRFAKSILIVTDMTSAGQGKEVNREFSEVRIGGDIPPSDFLAVLVPQELEATVLEILKEMNIKMKIITVGNRSTTFRVGLAKSTYMVPDYQSALAKIVEQHENPVFIHGVRLFDETDKLLSTYPELLEGIVDFNKVLAPYSIDPNFFTDRDIEKLYNYISGTFPNKEYVLQQLKLLPGYHVGGGRTIES
jgi:hypothetical protein